MDFNILYTFYYCIYYTLDILKVLYYKYNILYIYSIINSFHYILDYLFYTILILILYYHHTISSMIFSVLYSLYLLSYLPIIISNMSYILLMCSTAMRI